ncbi:recombinase family protein [Sinomicrobium oceani]|uniref:recombinase family protein n=1 Tax=Sinomicrobium oceani TaxID=1150368 RepID=UPI00227B76BA|nr:recombinase family protein [Sinomicrobium oceani]
MGKIADLYVRVSTDEQAEKGYSQRDQEERLRRYCEINDIHIREVVFEDHSAKSFNRPEWKRLLLSLRRHKNKVDLILFTKWDRFSRNAGDAYQMISTLRKLGIEPQAVEQPLDMSVPENKMMLAFYLAAPEVENDRRSLNTFFGMRRARKEGRYMGQAPAGYVNKVKEDGTKYIAPKDPEASIIRWAFEEVAREVFNTAQIWKKAKEKGFKKSRSRFWVILRNPVYCGKIFIPKYKDEESCLVDGLHEALISEELFYRVQEVMDGREKSYRPKVEVIEELPLRGFLICPECGKLLTGSKSKGRNRYYAYYHCQYGCSHRVRAEQVNKTFENGLRKYIPREEIKKLYTSLLMEEYREQTRNVGEKKRQILKQIKDYEERLSYARDLLSTKRIDPLDYRDMKSDYGEAIRKLEAEFARINTQTKDIEGLLNQGIDNLLQLNACFEKGGWEEFRGVIGSIYPKNLTFDRNYLRTTRINVIVERIYHINNDIGQNKNGTKKKISSLSRKVAGAGLEPATFGL